MKKLSQLAVIGGAVCCLSFGSVAVADNHTDTAITSPSAMKNSSGGVSFVIEAKNGKLTQVNGKNYQLVIPLSDLSSVLAFSGRPNHVALHMTPDQFSQVIHSGNNSFDKTPPNMALTVDGGNSMAFEIMGSSKDQKNITYQLLLIGDQSSPQNMSGNVSLFIDTFPVAGMAGIIS